jgi:PAS domain S-box-containing protein
LTKILEKDAKVGDMERKAKILILDCSKTDAEKAEFQIKNAIDNCKVKIVDNEDKINSSLEEFKPDLVISEVNFTHFDINSLVSLNNNTRPTPLIILTNEKNEELVLEYMKSGVKDYVIKEHIKRLGPAVFHRLEERQKEHELFFLKQDLQDLEKYIERYRRWESNVPAMVYQFVLHPDGYSSFTYVSSASKKLFGYRPEEITKNAKTLFKNVLPEELLKLEKAITESAKNLEPFKFKICYKKDAETKCFDFRATPNIEANGDIVWDGIMLDITEQRKAEEAFNYEHELMRTLMDNIPDVIYLKDLDSRFIKINKGYINKYGFTSESEILGKTDFDIFSDEHAKDARNDELAIIATGEPIIDKLEKETWHSGKVTWVSTTKIPLKNSQGKIIGTFGISRDITAVKETELALQESESILRKSQSAGKIGSYIFYMKSQTWKSSEIFDEILGIDKNYIRDFVGWIELIHPEDRHEISKYYNGDLIKTRKRIETEYRIIRNDDGKERWVLCQADVEYDNKGIPKTIVGTFQDITQRKEAHQKLLSSESRLRQLLSATSFVIYIIKISGRKYKPVWVSDTIKQYGYTTEEVLEKNWWTKTVHPDDMGYFRMHIPELFNTGKVIVEYRFRHKEGNYLWVRNEMVIVRGSSGEPKEIICSGVDITKQMKMHEAFLKSESQLINALKIAQLGYWEYDVEKDLFTFNDQFYSLLRTDIKKEGSYFMTSAEYAKRFVHPDDAYLIGQQDMQESLQTSDPNYSNKLVHRVIYADGETGYFAVRFFVTKNEEGVTVKSYGANQDITEQVIREKEKEDLENQVRQRNKELEKMISDLKQMQGTLVQSEKMASIGQLTAGIAHEINNPLAFVSSNVNRLNEYFQDAVNLLNEWRKFGGSIIRQSEYKSEIDQIEEQTQEVDLEFIQEDFEIMMKSIQDGTERIKKIVEGLRGFAHMSDASFSKTSINQAIDDTLTIVWNELKYKAEIQKEYGELPPLNCNIGEIKQVLVNLLVNASHSLGGKGIIKIITFIEDDIINIKIQDTGCGIPKDKLKRIFDPFYTTKEVGKGTGLGLWISSTIIEKHNGVIKVESEVGKGTIFTIKLPVNTKPVDEIEKGMIQ